MKMNRLIALLLVMVCVLGLLAAPALADEPENPAEPAVTETPEASTEPTLAPETTPTPEPETTPTPEPEATPTPEPTPTPTPTPEPTPKPGPWYQEAMDYAQENGLLKGDDKGNLNPTKSATRAEIATILRRVFGNAQGKDITHFSDVTQTAWFYPELSVMAEMGILKGDTAYTMRPNDPISRQEAFALIARAFRVPEADAAKLNSFPDGGKVADWAKRTLAGMVNAGLIQGDEKGNLNPGGNITRAEFAQVLYNMNIQFCSNAADLPQEGLVVYTGPGPVELTGFAGTLYLGGGTAMTLTGDAPEAQIVVRMEPNAKVTVDGAVQSVALCSNGAALTGSGQADAVGQYASACQVALKNGKLEKNYDDGLRGLQTKQTSPVPALTPENRTVNLYITYHNMSETGAVNGARDCTLRWWLDGVRQPDRKINLKNPDVTPGFTVSEPLWKRNMPTTQHKIKVQLLYGTDCVTNEFTVAVNNYTDAEYAQIAKNASYPYRIEVVKNQCTVLVYGLDKSGNYSILHRAFVCSPGQATPIGTFRTPQKMRWGELMGGVWGQYCTIITGGFYFHSVYYQTTDPSTLYYSAYNQLGTICSHGCVRVTVEDAKWMYDNCPLGTTVRIYESNTLPVPKPTAQKIPTNSPYRGWDPTDPDPRNPWKK